MAYFCLLTPLHGETPAPRCCVVFHALKHECGVHSGDDITSDDITSDNITSNDITHAVVSLVHTPLAYATTAYAMTGTA